MKVIKPFVNFLLSATILVSAIGIPVNRHYCYDHLVDVRLFTAAIPCTYATTLSKDDCPISMNNITQGHKKSGCHDTHETVKLKNPQNTFSFVVLAKLFPIGTITFTPYISLLVNFAQSSALSVSHSPPLIQTDKNIQFHSFLI